MRRRRISGKRIIAISLAAGAGLTVFFAYFGIEAARNLDVSMYDSTVISKDEHHTRYDALIQFRNTSFVPLTIGYTTYNISIDDEYTGTGTIDPFMLGPYATVLVNSDFTGNNAVLDRYGGEIPHERTQLSGTSNYNLYFTNVDVPLNHQPTAEQVERFTSN